MSVLLRTKWLRVRVPLQSLKLQISRLFRARSSWHPGNYVWIHSETRMWHDKDIQIWWLSLNGENIVEIYTKARFSWLAGGIIIIKIVTKNYKKLLKELFMSNQRRFWVWTKFSTGFSRVSEKITLQTLFLDISLVKLLPDLKKVFSLEWL